MADGINTANTGVNYCFPILQPRAMTLMDERQVSENGYWAVIKHTGNIKPPPELGEVGAFCDQDLGKLVEAFGKLQKLEADLARMNLNSAQIAALPETIARIEEDLMQKGREIAKLDAAMVRLEEERRRKDEERKLQEAAHNVDLQRRDLVIEDATRKCEQSAWILAQRWGQIEQSCEQLTKRMAGFEAAGEHLQDTTRKAMLETRQKCESIESGQKRLLEQQQSIESGQKRFLEQQQSIETGQQKFLEQLALKQQQSIESGQQRFLEQHQSIESGQKRFLEQLAQKQQQEMRQVEDRLASLEHAESEHEAANAQRSNAANELVYRIMNLERRAILQSAGPEISMDLVQYSASRNASGNNNPALSTARNSAAPRNAGINNAQTNPGINRALISNAGTNHAQNNPRINVQALSNNIASNHAAQNNPGINAALSNSGSYNTGILNTCVVCMAAPITVRFQPCLHEVTCTNCFYAIFAVVREGAAVPCVMCRVPIISIEEIPENPHRVSPIAAPHLDFDFDLDYDPGLVLTIAPNPAPDPAVPRGAHQRGGHRMLGESSSSDNYASALNALSDASSFRTALDQSVHAGGSSAPNTPAAARATHDPRGVQTDHSHAENAGDHSAAQSPPHSVGGRYGPVEAWDVDSAQSGTAQIQQQQHQGSLHPPPNSPDSDRESVGSVSTDHYS